MFTLKVRKRVFLRHLFYTNDHFAKTGSGQSEGKLKKEYRFGDVHAQGYGIRDGQQTQKAGGSFEEDLDGSVPTGAIPISISLKRVRRTDRNVFFVKFHSVLFLA
eukprot:COSAG06_NODE_858_length_11909_cov_6.018036_12_plen_105_part_00